MKYLKELNAIQRQAVENTKGASLIIAGAGSGKTKVLISRIVHLLNLGVDPTQILALTFTNKAAKEMKVRIGKYVSESIAKSLFIGTFHSVFSKILRIESEKLGYPRNFMIYDSEDSKRVIKEIVKNKGLEEKTYKPNEVLSRISKAKNNLYSPEVYLANIDLVKQDAISKKPEIGYIYSEYASKCFKSGAMDFDDLLFKMNILLRDFPEVKEKYQRQFQYILVDEYQDTNFSQYLIIKNLSLLHGNVSVVGDDSQSIYSFRGATISNILNFKKDYPQAMIFKLEQNYRSTQNIVKAANTLIKHNKDKIDKKVWTQNKSGEKIFLYHAINERNEAEFTIQQILKIKQEQNAENKDFAILYRTNAQSRVFEDSFRRTGLKYKIYGGLSFYQRREIKDVLAYFRCIVNPQDDDAILRIINYPIRGIGETTISKINLFASSQNKSIWDIISDINIFPIKLSTNVKNKIFEFVDMINQFREVNQNKNAFETADLVVKHANILIDLKNEPESDRYENVQELLNSIQDFVSNDDEEEKKLDVYIQDVPLLTDQDELDENEDNVLLMTIHSSKGLEFKYVFIVGIEENIFPSWMSIEQKNIEEERRLFYVAITRAEKQCFLSAANERYRFGKIEENTMSRFLNEIDSSYIEEIKNSFQYNLKNNRYSKGGQKYDKKKSKNTFIPEVNYSKIDLKKNIENIQKKNILPLSNSDDKIKIGIKVKHEKFGIGIVQDLEIMNGTQKAVVNFEKYGKKALLLKFAKLEIINFKNNKVY